MLHLKRWICRTCVNARGKLTRPVTVWLIGTCDFCRQTAEVTDVEHMRLTV